MSKSESKELYVTAKATRSTKYHTDKECQYLSNTDPREVTPRYIEVRDLELCQECREEEYREPGYHLKYIEKYVED